VQQALQEKTQSAEKQLTGLRQELEKSNASLATLQKDTTELRKISALANDRLKQTKEQIKAAQEEKQVLREALKKRESEIAQLQAHINKEHSKETAKVDEVDE